MLCGACVQSEVAQVAKLPFGVLPKANPHLWVHNVDATPPMVWKTDRQAPPVGVNRLRDMTDRLDTADPPPALFCARSWLLPVPRDRRLS